MTPREFLDTIITPGLDRLASLGGPPKSPDTSRILLSIALQESGPTLSARYQNYPSTYPGLARGFWMFEQAKSVTVVLNHSATKEHARNLCRDCTVIDSAAAVWRTLEGHNDLSVGFARLLLWIEGRPPPETESDGWDCYTRNWRPARPKTELWTDNWKEADLAVKEHK